jgi:hypothetical protein
MIENTWMVHTIYPDNIRSIIRYNDGETFVCCVLTYKGFVYNDVYTPTKK